MKKSTERDRSNMLFRFRRCITTIHTVRQDTGHLQNTQTIARMPTKGMGQGGKGPGGGMVLGGSHDELIKIKFRRNRWCVPPR